MKNIFDYSTEVEKGLIQETEYFKAIDAEIDEQTARNQVINETLEYYDRILKAQKTLTVRNQLRQLFKKKGLI
jgi:hypothetical protein